MKVRCISTEPYLMEMDGRLREGEFEGQMISLTLGKFYDVLEEDHGYVRLVDESGEDYWYPKGMFDLSDG